MKRTVLLGALLVAVLACTLALSTAKPLHALKCCDFGGYQTEHHWHMEATCADAQAAHRALSFPEAQAFCGATNVCAFTLPGCYFAEGMWVVDGPATFGCLEFCTIDPQY
jgi:hypothetical protein